MPVLPGLYGDKIYLCHRINTGRRDIINLPKPTCYGKLAREREEITMRLSYSNNSMIPKGIDTKKLHFEKINETHVGLPVLGLFENPKSKYGTSYSLVSVRDGHYIGINIPSWLGSEIKADFEESGLSVSKFFNTVIESVTEIPTEKGNPTKGVTFGYAK